MYPPKFIDGRKKTNISAADLCWICSFHSVAALQTQLLDPTVPSHIACGFPSADARWNSERLGCVTHASVGVCVLIHLVCACLVFGGEGTVGHMVDAGTWAEGSDVKRVSAAAGPVALIKVRILPHAASPGKGQGMARIRHKVLHHLHHEG